MRAISQDERDTYKRDGCVLLPNLVDEASVARLKRAADEKLDAMSGDYRVVWSPHRWDETFQSFVWGSGLAGSVGELIDEKSLRVVTSEVWAKEPQSEEPIVWHNDISYYPFRAARICSVWTALVDVPIAMSGMEFIPGSHRWERFFKPRVPSVGQAKERLESADFEELPDFTALAEQYPGAIRIRSWDVRAGDGIAFSGWILHHTGSNHGSARRVAYSVRFLPDAGAEFVERASSAWPPEVAQALEEGRPAISGYPEVLHEGASVSPPALITQAEYHNVSKTAAS